MRVRVVAQLFYKENTWYSFEYIRSNLRLLIFPVIQNYISFIEIKNFITSQ